MAIAARTVARMREGKRQLLLAAEAGEYSRLGMGGTTIRVRYPVGAAIVADVHGAVIAGPIAPIDAMELAWQVLEGDERALTAPDTLLSLAAAVFGFGLCQPEPPSAAPAAAAEVSA